MRHFLVRGFDMAWKQETLGTVSAFVRGRPPWITLVHGFAGAPWDWCRILTLLGSDVPVALVELPGHGPEKRALPSDWTQASKDLALWLEPSRLVVGYSMGGRLLAAALSETPEPKRALLIGAHSGLSELERQERRRWDQAQVRLLKSESLTEFRRRWSALPILERISQDDEEQVSRLQSGRSKLRPTGLAWAMEHLGSGAMPSCRAQLAEMGHTIVWAAGDKDSKYCELSQALAAESPGWSFRQIPNSGHSAHLDNPNGVFQLIGAHCQAL